jgi:hypothetical protein
MPIRSSGLVLAPHMQVLRMHAAVAAIFDAIGAATVPQHALEGADLSKTLEVNVCSASRSHRPPSPTITPTSPNPQLQFTLSFAPAATPCELHPTSAHPPHSTSHHRECCPPVRLTLCIRERMVHA